MRSFGRAAVVWRQYRTRPVLLASIVVTLATAIGLNTALVSIIRGVLLQPFGFRDQGQIVFLWDESPAGRRQPFAPARALEIRDRGQSIDGAALVGHIAMAVTGMGEVADRWSGASVSANFFDVLGSPAALGRTFHASDENRDTVVLSDTLWRSAFNGDPRVIGRAITMNGRRRTVVGVMPRTFFWPQITADPSAANPPLFWTSADASDVPERPTSEPGDPRLDRRTAYLREVARLKTGVAPAPARVELDAVAAELAREHPDTDRGHRVDVVPADEQFFGAIRRPLWLLLSATWLVLVVAAANVGNLLLIRLSGRARELAVRRALGAGRARLLGQLCGEGLALALPGAVVGLVLARAAIAALVRLAPQAVGRLDRVTLDPVVFAVAAGMTALLGFALGLLPAMSPSFKADIAELRTSGAAGRGRGRLRQLLVGGEVAIAMVLVAGAALFVESLLRLERVDVGFDTTRLLTFDVNLAGGRAKPPASTAYFDALLERIRALPGVEHASAAVTLPIGGDDFGTRAYAEGFPLPPLSSDRSVGEQIVWPGWFDALGMRLIEGRDFTLADAGATPVVAINETLARALWPNVDPIGRRLRTRRDDDAAWFTVVAVVSDIHHLGPGRPARPELYEPYAQNPFSFMAVAVRTSGDPLAMVGPIRAAGAEIDSAQPLSNFTTMAAYLSRAYGDSAFLAALMSVFGMLALGLAVVGVYGAVSVAVAQRTRELALRAALGATPGSLLGRTMREGLTPPLVGSAAGILLALAATRAAAALLFGTSSSDPTAYAVAAGLILCAAGAACWAPARRAARIDPAVALRDPD